MPSALSIVLSLALVVGAPATRADDHTLTPYDLVTMDRLSDPQPSPDGRAIAFVRRVTDMDADKGRTDLWLVNLDGSGSVFDRIASLVAPQ